MRKYLKDVTLFAYSSNEVVETLNALRKCQDIQFAETKILSHKIPENLPDDFVYEYAPEIKDINDFNYYMFMELGKHINTSHALYVQAHAWIAYADLWDDDWLEYDYIGAGWPLVKNSYIANDGTIARVGNGGFSLRSKKLMDLPKKMGWELREEQGWRNEDGNICCYWRKEMLENGIKYAPLEVAVTFAYENTIPENVGITPFGFHRNFPSW